MSRLTWKICVFIALVTIRESVTLLAFHESKGLSSFKRFESRNIQRGFIILLRLPAPFAV